jgi:pimeloyl-ACP methyl ester carboxylesterase
VQQEIELEVVVHGAVASKGAPGNRDARDEGVERGGRTVRCYDTGEADADLALVWHHGTPQTGRLLEPVVQAARVRGIRVVSCARAGYPGTDGLPGRRVADAAADVVAVARRLGLERYVAAGASGGGPHALGCAALDPEHVVAAITFAGIAPLTGDAACLPEADWFAGMASPQGLRSALHGRAVRAAYGETAEFEPASFIDADYETLKGPWSTMGADAGAASGAPGEVDDDVAFVSPWRIDLDAVRCPVLVLQGEADRVVPVAHGEWLARRISDAELWRRPGDGHISVLRTLPEAVDWALARIS